MIVCITGSRFWPDSHAYHVEREVINFIRRRLMIPDKVTRVISGDGTGVDTICHNLIKPYCEELGIEFDIFEADWHTHKKAAGPIRNKLMTNELKEGDACLAFPIWDKYISSPGTCGTMRLAKARKADVLAYDPIAKSLTNW